MPEDQKQSQSQTQALTLTLNLGQNSSDPELERKVLNEMYSAGSQLGRISDVIEVVLRALATSTPVPIDADAAVQAFRAMQREIAAAKQTRAPELRFVRELDALREHDAPAYERTLRQLREYLDARAAELRPPSAQS